MPADGYTHELRFRKAERLCSRTLRGELFRNGVNIYAWPLRLVWLKSSSEAMHRLFSHGIPAGIAPLQLMITVPKKKRHHAVDRVLMRRRIREAYRLARLPLKERLAADSEAYTASLAIIYMADENLDYAVIEKSIKRLISKLQSRL